ncbi:MULTISPECIES: hypothetical protein [unclassified Mycobacterium]|uniref:hypothetical protein n=1 Tax=unclassified Mycobacterium TaxID=2642494 RepID=UPI0029C6FBF7|nr:MULTISPECIES: hypothetical protein [unclassified Mycobacterium]
MKSDPPLTARWRGIATAALTAALAVAAHGAAGGPTPSGAGAAVVGVMAITLGALATAIPKLASWPGLLALLASGQLFGHVLLGSAGHQHSAMMAGHHAAVMTAAHVVAVIAGAALIAAAGRLSAALSRAVRSAIAPQRVPVGCAPAPAFEGDDQPLQSSLLLAASVSHRGPPVRLAS